MTDRPDPPHHGGRLHLRWDGTVTAGNVLIALPMVVGLVIWGARLESRVNHESDLRSRLEAQVQRDRINDDRLFEVIRAEIRTQGEQTRAALDRLVDKIERKADRP
jgi:cell shape-determining protein MreC